MKLSLWFIQFCVYTNKMFKFIIVLVFGCCLGKFYLLRFGDGLLRLLCAPLRLKEWISDKVVHSWFESKVVVRLSGCVWKHAGQMICKNHKNSCKQSINRHIFGFRKTSVHETLAQFGSPVTLGRFNEFCIVDGVNHAFLDFSLP